MATNEEIIISRNKRNGQTSEFIELKHVKHDATVEVSKIEEVNDDTSPQGNMESIRIPLDMVEALMMQINRSK